MSILSLNYDLVNQQYVNSIVDNTPYPFGNLYYNDFKAISLTLLRPTTASVPSQPFDLVDNSGSFVYVNLGIIDSTGSITNITSSVLTPSASVWTGLLSISGPNLDNFLNLAPSVDVTWQLKLYTSQSIDTIDERNVTIFKTFSNGSIVLPPVSVFITSASYALSASYSPINSILSSSYALSASYALSSNLPVVNNNMNEQKQIDLNTLSIDQLKVIAYDMLMQLNQIQQDSNRIQQNINMVQQVLQNKSKEVK